MARLPRLQSQAAPTRVGAGIKAPFSASPSVGRPAKAWRPSYIAVDQYRPIGAPSKPPFKP